jgi:hypothetical protein
MSRGSGRRQNQHQGVHPDGLRQLADEFFFTFFEMHNLNPHFAVQLTDKVGGERRCRCQLTCPEVTAQGRVFPQTVFTADARTMEGAEHHVIRQALGSLRASGLIPPAPQPRM